MNRELVDIEIKDLIVIKGTAGLWKIRNFSTKTRIVNAINIVTEQIKSSPANNVSSISDYIIYKKDSDERLQVEDSINKLMELAETETIPAGREFKKLDENFKTEFMEKVAPEHSDLFKDYHMEKILKWYEEVEKYFKIANKDIENL